MSDSAKVLEQLGAVKLEKLKSPFIHAKVERLAARAKIEKPHVYAMQDDAPNACAIGLSDNDMSVAVTTGLLRQLDEHEIEAVLAHEIGHIQKGHSIAKTAVAAKAMGLAVAANFGGVLIQTSDLDFTPGDGDSYDFESMLIKVIVSTVVQAAGAGAAAKMTQAVSFDSEFEADECGGALSRKPWALARALRRIEELAIESRTRHAPGVSRLFIVPPERLHYATHPPTTDRIARLELMDSLMPQVYGAPTVFCGACGEKTDSDGKFCYWCGDELH